MRGRSWSGLIRMRRFGEGGGMMVGGETRGMDALPCSLLVRNESSEPERAGDDIVYNGRA